MTKMIFEGKVDEAEVGKIKVDTDLEIVIGAIDDAKFPAKLNFIATKGNGRKWRRFSLQLRQMLSWKIIIFYVQVIVQMLKLF